MIVVLSIAAGPVEESPPTTAESATGVASPSARACPESLRATPASPPPPHPSARAAAKKAAAKAAEPTEGETADDTEQG